MAIPTRAVLIQATWSGNWNEWSITRSSYRSQVAWISTALVGIAVVAVFH